MSTINSMIKKIVSRLIPKAAKSIIKKYRRSAAIEGDAYCVVCNSSAPQFLPFGDPKRQNARCIKCGSLERHRLIWSYLKDKTNLLTEGKSLTVLHFAPEKFFFNKFSCMSTIEYVPCDLFPELFKFDRTSKMVKVDVTSIPFPDDHFDAILCNHVLEHIPDDRLAMRELFRVMKKGGWGIFQVPIDYALEKTFEDFTITSPEARKAAFGQDDHVRWYGRDYKERLESVGFVVDENNYVQQFSPEDIFKYGFRNNELLYHCHKR